MVHFGKCVILGNGLSGSPGNSSTINRNLFPSSLKLQPGPVSRLTLYSVYRNGAFSLYLADRAAYYTHAEPEELESEPRALVRGVRYWFPRTKGGNLLSPESRGTVSSAISYSKQARVLYLFSSSALAGEHVGNSSFRLLCEIHYHEVL